MKFILAVIQPHKLEDVRKALADLGVEGMTVSEVQGFGRQMGHTEVYRGAEYAVNYVPKVKIEIAAASDKSTAIVDAIKGAANSGKIGDGKIFVLDLAEVVRVRTGETGTEAL